MNNSSYLIYWVAEFTIRLAIPLIEYLIKGDRLILAYNKRSRARLTKPLQNPYKTLTKPLQNSS